MSKTSSRKPVVSACLIVRNEEVNLGRCLRSVVPAVDEIVVVDTGSTDRTVEIAQAHGARTHSFTWCDDFSAARNESLRHARGEFILWVDADDELIEREPGTVRRLCRKLPVDSWGYWVDVVSPIDVWDDSQAVLKQTRLIRNGIGMQFFGRVHEQAKPPADVPDVVSFQDALSIKHWGYIEGRDVGDRRSERNRRLIELMIQEQPEDAFNYFNLGLQHANAQQWADGLAAFERGIELWCRHPAKHDGFVAGMFAHAAMCALQMGDFRRTLAIESETPTKYNTSDLLHHTGIAHWRLGQLDEAVARLDRAITDESLANNNMHDPSTSTWRPWLLKASIHAERDDFEQAYQCAHAALELAPGKPEAMYVLGLAALQLGRPEEAAALAREGLAGPRNGDAKEQMRRLLKLTGAAEKTEPPLISACLIVRDEEANIHRALGSLAGVVDEIVVVDTGSKDRTPEIAAAAGARVVPFEWCDDFAAARNESLRHANGRWIIYVDADEELVQSKPNELRRLCANFRANEAGAYVTIRNPIDTSGQEEVVGQQWRIFRNQPDTRFEGRIHEQLRCASGTPKIRGAEKHGLFIRHSGYIDDGNLLGRKGERNRRLLELTLAEQPNEPAHHFFLGRQYAWERQFDRALPVLRRAIELWLAGPRQADGYVPSMFSTAALAALQESQAAVVLEIEGTTPPRFISAELLFTAGVACARLGKVPEAIGRLNRAWRDKTLATASGSDPSTSSWRPLLALGEIYESLGQLEDARMAVRKALELAPGRQDLEEFRERLSAQCHSKRSEESASEVSQRRRTKNELIDESRRRSKVPRRVASRNDMQSGDIGVSACMIVRNEAANLRRWLPLVRSAVDELIVVDTGSEDETAQVAAELGASVHHFTWCDDFAAARNESLRHATGRWILWLDADDELVLQSPDALRKLCQTLPDSVHGCWVAVQSTTTADGAAGASLRQWRLFRNGLDLRFKGRIHEQLWASPERGPLTLVEQSEVRVTHWGYSSDPETMARKLARNRRLLELSIAEEPTEPMHHYALGKQLMMEGDYASADASLRNAVVLWRALGRPSYGFVAPMFSVLACTALNLGNNEQALAWEAECPPDAVSSDLLYYAGVASQRLGRPEEAVKRLTRAFEDLSVRNATETDPATATWQPRLLLAQVLTGLGRREEAYARVIEAVDLLPEGHPDVMLAAARLGMSTGHEDDTERICHRILDGPNPETTKSQARMVLVEIDLHKQAAPT